MAGGLGPNEGEVFTGVRFVLVGFDSVSEAQYRSELVRRGGTDVGRYHSSCTHVIVFGRVHDDPVCIAAKNDGKVLVTELWIEDSVDFSELANADRILYKPVKDLNGIPGSELLFICLTGYQRRERDDIMKMVELMGAHFSKPLIASKVTHLVCYKFEGEKYELARRVNIKLVNHQWLEDCLRAWEILPEDNYRMSGWELEIMEAEAKNSDDDSEECSRVRPARKRSTTAENSDMQSSMPVLHSPKPSLTVPDRSIIRQEDTVPSEVLHSKLDEVRVGNASLLNPSNEDCSAIASSMRNNGNITEKLAIQDGNGTKDSITNDAHLQNPDVTSDNIANVNDAGIELSPDSLRRSFSSYDAAEMKSGSASYSRKNRRKSVSTEDLARRMGCPQRSSKANDIPSSVPRGQTSNIGSADVQSPTTMKELSRMEGVCNALPQKRKVPTFYPTSIKSGLQNNSETSARQSYSAASVSSQLEASGKTAHQGGSLSSLDDLKTADGHGSPLISKSSVSGKLNEREPSSRDNEKACLNGKVMNSFHNAGSIMSPLHLSSTDLSTVGALSRSGCSTSSLHQDCDLGRATRSTLCIRNTVDNLGALSIDCQMVDGVSAECKKPERSPSKTSELYLKHDKVDVPMSDLSDIHIGENGQTRPLKDSGSSSGGNRDSGMGKLSDPSNPNRRVLSKALNKKVVAKKKLSCIGKPSVESKDRSSVYSNKVVSPNLSTCRREQQKEPEHGQKANDESDEMVGISKEVIMVGILQEPQNSSSKGDRISSSENITLNRNNETVGEHDFKSMEVEGPVLKGTSVNETNLMVKSVHGNTVVRGKMKKAHRLDVAPNAKNVPTVAVHPSDDTGKENKSIENTLTNSKIDKFGGKSAESTKRIDETATGQLQNHQHPKYISEPSCFILSGHRLQRKEFQKVIRRLKGRLCRDSHNWSYQATHFISPEPIRRTEKFFAAAASGRWILKSDYLAACNEAGKFLPEEPFEWYGCGLTEDGGGTGHGAFYGARIIVYGECIAPSLDTLKRVVKAGDGAILATSPPYTRLMNSGVDFAVISPSTPPSDPWVQEFLRHEIPCVLADYLVEHVCKAGYPLDRHVLYGSLPLAERALAALRRRSEEAVPPGEETSDDLSCSVCGSRERGDVMLICGDELGLSGCGAAMHTDCCQPPLAAVPEDDWFCPAALRTNPPGDR
ncbi:unnamed protein product [Spirodela intermedia]|uniref:BRCT domain-containing protein n=1 Tax=Spirodela intermedia TaxID=51605 RepID=A0A7I8IBX2_SPIIN|nr:unnamed protein product [Spirodela intermedia]CAA6654381.1 unnamed protein product [Spirodela intermedia]